MLISLKVRVSPPQVPNGALGLNLCIGKLFRAKDDYIHTKRDKKGPNRRKQSAFGSKRVELSNSVLLRAAKRSNGREKRRDPAILV